MKDILNSIKNMDAYDWFVFSSITIAILVFVAFIATSIKVFVILPKEYQESLKIPNYQECVSNINRPTLVMDKSKAEYSQWDKTVKFKNLNTNMMYTLHDIEDRDYWCYKIDYRQEFDNLK